MHQHGQLPCVLHASATKTTSGVDCFTAARKQHTDNCARLALQKVPKYKNGTRDGMTSLQLIAVLCWCPLAVPYNIASCADQIAMLLRLPVAEWCLVCLLLVLNAAAAAATISALLLLLHTVKLKIPLIRA